MSNLNSSYIGLRKDILRHINRKNSIVLDIGCAIGENGRYLLNNNLASKVIGIEIDSAMAEVSREKLTQVIVGNIESQEVIDKLPKGLLYDYIILGDVLEHLNQPWDLLKFLSGLLNEDGEVIISLPNVQHIDVFIHVFIKGVWPLNERGIFDKTHLRWFTHKNIINLVNSSDLRVVHIHRNFRFRDRKGSKFPFYGKFLKMLFKNLYTHQYIVVCKKK